MTTAQPHISGPPRILLAEDEPHIRRVLTTLLEDAGFQVDVAVDGREALDRVRSDTAYALILTDLMMPHHSGLEVLEAAQGLETRRGTPTVMLTAKGQDADRDRALELGASDFLTKPFSPRKLLGRIRQLLDL
ncbi:MAG: response regulator [Longimicrobiales bacterium]|nr:response regulator [Longimicrobiales bacterium]